MEHLNNELKENILHIANLRKEVKTAEGEKDALAEQLKLTARENEELRRKTPNKESEFESILGMSSIKEIKSFMEVTTKIK